MRYYVGGVIKREKVSERLVANFDQVWTVLFEPQPKIISKRIECAGQMADPLRHSKVKRSIRRQMQEKCGLPLTDPPSEQFWNCIEPSSLNATARLTPVDNWRTLDL